MTPEDLARNLAHADMQMKLAALPPWLKHPATLGGAGVGSVIGAVQGGRGSREGERGYGALAGGLFGAVAGGAAGYGVRTLAQTVPEGSKQIKSAKEALENELKAKNIVKPGSGAKAEELTKFKDARKEYISSQRDKMREATQLAIEGKHGQEAMDAVDKVRKNFGAVGELKSGREKFYGGLIGGGLGVGYGGHQLYTAKDINAPTPEEQQLRKSASADPAAYAAIRVGQLLAHF